VAGAEVFACFPKCNRTVSREAGMLSNVLVRAFGAG